MESRPAWLYPDLDLKIWPQKLSVPPTLPLPTVEEDWSQTCACSIHFIREMDPTINLFLHRFLQACTKRASQVSLCKAASCWVCFCCCWRAGLRVLAAELPSQPVSFKQRTRFDLVGSFPSGRIRVSLKREGWFLLCFIFPFPLF